MLERNTLKQNWFCTTMVEPLVFSSSISNFFLPHLLNKKLFYFSSFFLCMYFARSHWKKWIKILSLKWSQIAVFLNSERSWISKADQTLLQEKWRRRRRREKRGRSVIIIIIKERKQCCYIAVFNLHKLNLILHWKFIFPKNVR